MKQALLFVMSLVFSLCLAFSPGTSLAGQTVVINSPAPDSVWGNSPNTNGEWGLNNPPYDPADLLDANNNTVIINNDVSYLGESYGWRR
jgi:hypothetical protein